MELKTKFNIGEEVLTQDGDNLFVKQICVYIYPDHISGEVKNGVQYRLTKGDILSLNGKEDIYHFEDELLQKNR
jgi:hypothetical protein